MRVRCPHCRNPIDLIANASLQDVSCPSCGSSFNLLDAGTASYHAGPARTIGHFELIEQIGVGSFGSVWKARDTELHRTVAVKIPRKDQLLPHEMEQFFHEARAAAQLRHPHIVQVHEVGRDGGGSVYIVSDFVEGATLADWIAVQRPSPREAAELAIEIAEALHHAHEHGVIHRDLKPGNILMDLAGRPHLTDFGLAKREAGEITMTVEGRVLGTPAYMSPEQARGDAHHADRRSDVYSLGVIVFELLTGERPFRGSERMLVVQILKDEPPSPRRLNGAVPRDLETICLKCLEKEPPRRYQTAQEVAEELRRFLAGRPIEARPVSRPERVWRWSKRNPVIASLSAALALVLLAVAIAGPIAAAYQASLRGRAEELADDKVHLATDLENSLTKQTAATRDAQRRRAEAELQTKRATALRLAAQSQAVRDEFPQRSLLLAIESIEAMRRLGRSRLPESEQALRDGLAVVGGRPLPDTGNVRQLAAMADGRLVAADADGTVRIWDVSGKQPSVAMLLQGHKTASAPADWQTHSLAITPDNRWLALGGDAVRVWDLKAANPEASAVVLSGQRGVDHLVISPDGHWLVTGNYVDDTRLWDLTAKDPHSSVRILKRHEAGVCFAISPNARWLAASPAAGATQPSGFDASVRLWDLSAKEPNATPVVLRGYYANSLTMSSDGKWLAAGMAGGTANVWQLTGKEPPSVPSIVLRGPGSNIVCLAISPDNRWLAGGCWDGTAHLWDLTSQESTPISIVLRGHNAHISALAITPDSRWLVTASNDRTVRIWDLADDNPAARFAILRGHDGPITSLALAPDGRWLATAGGGRVRLWNIGVEDQALSPVILRGHATEVAALAISADSRRLASGGDDGTVRVFDLNTDDPTDSAVVLRGTPHRNRPPIIDALVFSPDARRLASGGRDSTVRVWDLTAAEPESTARVLRGSESSVFSLAIDRDGRRLVAGDYGVARIWDLSAAVPGKQPILLSGLNGAIERLRISSDGRWLAAAGSFDTVRLWRFSERDPRANPIILSATPESIRHYPLYNAALALSPNDRWLVAGIFDGTARVWDLSKPKPQENPVVLRGHLRLAHPAVISPNSRNLFTGDAAGTIRIWDLTARDPSASPAVIRAHDGYIEQMVISSDGSRLITEGDDTVRLWDMVDNQLAVPPVVLQSADDPQHNPAVSPDGRWLALPSSARGTTRLYHMRVDELMALARRVVGRELTADERRQYLGPDSDH